MGVKDATTYSWEEDGGVIKKFNLAIVLTTEFFAFNKDVSELLINLQQNSTLVHINTATATVSSIDSYGLKSFASGSNGVDIVKDDKCTFVKMTATIWVGVPMALPLLYTKALCIF